MTHEDLRTLVDYHYWARDRLLDALEPLTPEQFMRDLGNSFRSVRDTLGHLIGAEHVWCERWAGRSAPALPDPAAHADLAAIREAWQAQEQELRVSLARFAEIGIERPVEYRAFDGRAQAQPFWQLVQHVVNHGSYHRGQITTMLRQLGCAPAKSLDLIAFYRLQAAPSA